MKTVESLSLRFREIAGNVLNSVGGRNNLTEEPQFSLSMNERLKLKETYPFLAQSLGEGNYQDFEDLLAASQAWCLPIGEDRSTQGRLGLNGLNRIEKKELLESLLNHEDGPRAPLVLLKPATEEAPHLPSDRFTLLMVSTVKRLDSTSLRQRGHLQVFVQPVVRDQGRYNLGEHGFWIEVNDLMKYFQIAIDVSSFENAAVDASRIANKPKIRTRS